MQVTASANVVAGPRGLPSKHDQSAGMPDTDETSSSTDSSRADSPEDDVPAIHSSFGAILRQYSRPQSGGVRSGQSDRPGPQKKSDASDQALLVVPVQPNEKPRDIAPLTLAIPRSTDEVNPREGALGSFEMATADSPNTTPSLGKSATASNPLAAAQSDELAFAARLSAPGTPAAVDEAGADAAGISSIHARPNQKQTAWSDSVLPPAQAQDGKRASEVPGEQLAKTNATPLPAQFIVQSASQSDPAPPMKSDSHATAGLGHSPARVEAAAEPAPAQPGSSRDIMVRIPDATDRGTNVRFLERGSEVHVSVRTGDAELAQMLRGGLSELTTRLQHNGIQAEVWRPGADSSQSDSQNQAPDPKGSGERRNQSGAQRDGQDQPNENKPRWVEEMETSIGKPATQAGS